MDEKLLIKAGEIAVEAIINGIQGLGWRNYGGKCPECHSGPLFVRTLGVGKVHDQVVCARHPHIVGNGDGRCMWSRDENERCCIM